MSSRPELIPAGDFQEYTCKEATACVTVGYNPSEHHHAANPPIYLTSTFEFDTAEDCAAAFAGSNPAKIYSRLGNPTQDIVQKRIAALEHTEACLVTGSGMGAIASTLWTFLNAGDVLVASDKIYGCTYALMRHSLTRFGVTVEFVDMTDLDAVRAVLAKYNKVRMLYTETILNPTVDVVDLEALAELIHQKNGIFVVDNTFASPLGCNPIKFGADIVLHSATKFLIGGVYTAGAVCGSLGTINQIAMIGLKDCTGAVLSAELCFAMYEMIETLDVRFRRMSDNAYKVSQYLESHPRIERVICTGLRSHPQRSLAEKYIKISSPVISVFVKGTAADCAQIMDRFQLCLRAVSLGKTHTLLEHPASMTHSTYSPEERAKYGITDNMIRVSIGVEDVNDIIADFEYALREENEQ